MAAERIASFRHELDIEIEHTGLILNRLSGPVPDVLQDHIDQMGIPLLGVVPPDEELAALELAGRPFIELNNQSLAVTAVAEIISQLSITN